FMEEILKKIINKKTETINKKGTNFGITIPDERKVPLNAPDFSKGVMICEIKRGSPSEGKMNNIKNPVKWASDYIKAGACVISILTEQDFFYGSLQDLINIKEEFPQITVLRKDFLLTIEEIEVSYRAGADMVLLITSVLRDYKDNKDLSLLNKMKSKAEDLGMVPLIEVHNQEELEAVLPLKPKFIGINSRDLKTFKINRGYPIGLKKLIDESIYTIFESGIRNKTDAFFVGVSGFNSILVGSSIIKSGNIVGKISEIKRGFVNGRNNQSNFYTKIFYKIYIEKKLVVKICGITNVEDAKLAADAGADIIGFVFAKSPRRVKINEAKKISQILGTKVLKVGVVVDEDIQEVVNGVREGWLDAVQFHGDVDNDTAASYDVCWYKAIRVAKKEDFHKNYYSPILLYDAFSKKTIGGTGKRIDKDLLDYAKGKGIDLYLAGGITPENVRSIIDN
ncbi:MAG: hypothetical protein KAT05_14135, partial [Spirochaetes bacterium]|nr:hypothetical protein [Spirochaetota bacterium]